MARYQWAPDYSSVIDLDANPGAYWDAGKPGRTTFDGWDPGREAGWFLATGGSVFDAGARGGEGEYRDASKRIGSLFEVWDPSHPVGGDGFNNGYGAWVGKPGSKAGVLKQAGLWNLSDRNSDTYRFLNGISAPWGGNVLSNPDAMWRALQSAYMTDGTDAGIAARDQNIYNDLVAAGFNPQYAASIRDASGGYTASVKHAP
jgi:hypothetical protein